MTPMFRGYQYIFSFAKRLQDGRELTPKQMAQAKRLLAMDPETVTEKEVRTIEAADIEEPPMNRQRDEKRRIGF